MKKRKCVHYHYVGAYSLDTCSRNADPEKCKFNDTEFDCKDCPDFRTHTSGLERCPFCGGKPYLGLAYEYKNEWEIICQKCRVSMKAKGVKNVVKKWNSRKPL